MPRAMPFGLVPELRWKVPKDIHRTIVHALDARRLALTSKSPDPQALIPEHLRRKLPTQLLGELDQLQATLKSQEQRVTRAAWLLPICMVLVFALIGIVFVSFIASRRQVAGSAFALAPFIGGAVGLFLYGAARLEARGQAWRLRRTPPSVWIRESRMGSHGAYSLMWNQVFSHDDSTIISRDEVTVCSLHRVSIGEKTFDALIVETTPGMQTMYPIAPSESIEEMLAVMTQWRYPVSVGGSIKLEQ